MTSTTVTSIARATILAMGTAAFLTACQTTGNKIEEKPIDVEDTHVIFPDELLENPNFEIKEATLRESGSFRQERVYFTNGFIIYDRYFRGGFSSVTKSNFEGEVREAFQSAQFNGETNVMRAEMGQIFYNDFKTGKGATCVAMKSNQGRQLRFASGTGHQGIITGIYCEDGDKPDLEETVVAWMKDIELEPY